MKYKPQRKTIDNNTTTNIKQYYSPVEYEKQQRFAHRKKSSLVNLFIRKTSMTSNRGSIRSSSSMNSMSSSFCNPVFSSEEEDNDEEEEHDDGDDGSTSHLESSTAGIIISDELVDADESEIEQVRIQPGNIIRENRCAHS
jgi:hypothetical protein